MKNLSFSCKKNIDGQKFLMKRNDIIASRMEFLREIHNARNKSLSRSVTYFNETWLNANHSSKYVWQSSTNQGGLKVSLGKDQG